MTLPQPGFTKSLFHNAEIRRSLIVVLPLLFVVLMTIPLIRATFTPFVLAGLSAYLLLPIVRILSRRLHLPHLVSVSIVFILLIAFITVALTQIIKVVNIEFKQLKEDAIYISVFSKQNINALPDWSRDSVEYFSQSFRDFSKIKQSQTLPILRNTAEGIIYFFSYVIATFYFMKDAEKIGRKLSSVPAIHKANKTIQNYFRGLLILIVVMSTLTYIFLRVLDVRFAFLLSVFTGFAEILPYVGPYAAAGMTCLVAIATGLQAFGYPLPITLIIIAAGYFILRQFEDFFVIPFVIGKSIELHPLVILITTLLAGKVFGFFGLLFGVPFVGTYKVLLDYWISETEKN